MSLWWSVLKQLTAITLCAALVDLMMPSGSMRRYARLVSGLILMYVLMRPISALITGNPEAGAELLNAMLGQAEAVR